MGEASNPFISEEEVGLSKRQKPNENLEQAQVNVYGDTPTGDFVYQRPNATKRQATSSSYSEYSESRPRGHDADKARFYKPRPTFQDPNDMDDGL